jgi:hypothetical protein
VNTPRTAEATQSLRTFPDGEIRIMKQPNRITAKVKGDFTKLAA